MNIQEAFDEWFGQDGGHEGNPVRYQTFKAGYAAAIAAVKEGGPIVYKHLPSGEYFDQVIACAFTEDLISLYRLPDDET